MKHAQSFIRWAVVALVLSVSFFPQALTASEFDVVINEIHYNPVSGDNNDEYIELYNRGGTAVDLSGWRLSEGVQFTFPGALAIGPKEFLLVSPSAFQTKARYGVQAVVGDYFGRLDNNGEVLMLVNARGDMISRLHYEDGGVWPSSADGLGPSLELTNPHARPDFPQNWTASLIIGGTPGAANSTAVDVASLQELVIINPDEVWRYLKGTNPYPNGWEGLNFNDAGWDSGPTSIGFTDMAGVVVRTPLSDMQNNYISFAARKKFTITVEQIEGDRELFFLISYDDGFVAILNGQELARSNLGAAGTAVAFDAPADSSINQTLQLFPVPKAMVQVGQNILAVQVHNRALNNHDVLFEPMLVSRIAIRPPSQDLESPVVLNEIKPQETAGAGFIELYNRTGSPKLVGGWKILDTLGHQFSLPGITSIPAHGWASFSTAQLGFATGLSSVTYLLVEADGKTFVDGLNPSPGAVGEHGYSFGRFPDGDNDGFVMTAPTAGARNQVSLPSSMVVNEIYFHPPYVPPGGGCFADCSDLEQWIELHNRSGQPVDLSGWSLSKAVEIAIPAGTPPVAAGGFLIVAASKARFQASHPSVPAAQVVGDWTKALSHDSDTINLRDALGNLVDHVKYGDGSPLNDLEPADGIDDRTFHGSEWPVGADGSGKTLELINPNLDNRLGGAWTPGPAGGTPAAASAGLQAVPAPVIGEVTHSPPVPRSTESVQVTCRVAAAASSVSQVRLLWKRDPNGTPAAVTLLDDGLSGDGEAGDGIYGGSIPAQPDNTRVAFQIEAKLVSGQTTLAPKPPPVAPYAEFEGPYYLYQVINRAPLANPSPNYTIVMFSKDQQELAGQLSDGRPVTSDVLLYCTFIQFQGHGQDEVHHLAGIRYRSETGRTDPRKSYRIDFPPEKTFRDMEHLNVNAQDIDDEVIAEDLFFRAGLPSPQCWTVNLTFQGTLDPLYDRKEHFNEDFLKRYFGGGSDDGNFYRALDPDNNQTYPYQGDLRYFGPDPDDYRPYYDKRSNKEEDDYSDIAELCKAFDPAQTPNDVFPDRLEQLIDANQWARFFAVQSALSNIDGSIQTATGEDYFLYHVPATSNRPDAGKWLLLPWDVNEVFANSTERLFRPDLAAIRRFLTHPRFAPLYYGNIINLRNGLFSRLETRQRYFLINFLFGFGTIDGIETFITQRIGFYDENIPTGLSAGAAATSGSALVNVGDTWRYFKGTQEPPGAALAWTQRAFNDAPWAEGPGSFGYGYPGLGTPLNDMENGYTTVYIRRVFSVADPSQISSLQLNVDYDDGFVAYLNGTEVARGPAGFGTAGTPVPFDGTAPNHTAAGAEPFNISTFANKLVAGNNVLAIQGVNRASNSGDLLLAPELTVGGSAGGGLGCGEMMYATQDVIGLSGRANAALTATVKVNGAAAAFDPYRATWQATVSLLPGDNLVTIEAFDAANASIDKKELVIRRFTGSINQVAGALAGNTVWRPADGPYLMTGNVTVPAGATLAIDPGTVIFGQAGASIIVRGRISASGTPAQPILFRAARCDNRMGGIAIDGTGTAAGDPTSILKYVDIEFGDNPQGFAGCVAPVNSKILIDHCQFRSLTANAVDGTNARVEVRDSYFSAIHEGVHCTSSTVIIVDSTFDGMVGDTDAIDFDLNGTERSRIEGNLILNSSDDGIDLAAATVDIRDNLFFNIQDKALSLEQNGPLGPPTVTGNLIYNCGSGITLKDGITIQEGSHNTVVGCQEGLNLFARAGAADGGHGLFHSMIIWNNIADVKLDNKSTIDLTFSDASQGQWPGAGNMSKDPRFMNVLLGNFALKPGSPCIGTGKNGTDMGAFPFTGSQPVFIRGDADSNTMVEIADAVLTLEYLFLKGTGAPCQDRMDANDDGELNIADPVYSLLYIFVGGRQPPAPFPSEGPDPTNNDTLTCS